MRSFWLVLGGAMAAVALAMIATIPTRLGFDLWQYNASFAIALAASLAMWPWWRTRRFTSIMLAVTGLLATATGGAMLYTKDFPYKEWLTWWHSFTSVTFTIAFLVHWLHNNPRLTSFLLRLFKADRAWGYTVASIWLAIAGLSVWTSLPGVRSQFTRENYLYLASWAVLVGVAFTWGLWLAFRVPALRARLVREGRRNRARALVDTSLFIANWGALLTGFALLYFSDFLRGGEFKYVSKWWHTATSAALLALVTLHIGFNARILGSHAKRADEDIRQNLTRGPRWAAFPRAAESVAP